MKINRRTFFFSSASGLCAQVIPPEASTPKAVRFPGNPIISPEMPTVGADINGPSLIIAPKWLARPLGRYYLYFAGHRGTSIRLAYADRLAGPWKIYEPGVLQLDQTGCRGHIASPDVHIDNDPQRVRMYFHGPVKGGGNAQRSFLAVSNDGLQFSASTDVLGLDYFRVFQRDGYYYAISNGGKLQRSNRPDVKFTLGPDLFPTTAQGRVRHVAVKLDGDILGLFYSRIADNPESILVSTVRMTPDWNGWRASEGKTVLRPELPYEGVDLPLRPSADGPAKGRVRQLRDPAIYREGGKTYLLYSVAGESGIAIAELQ